MAPWSGRSQPALGLPLPLCSPEHEHDVVCLQALAEVCAVCNETRIEGAAGKFKVVGAPTEAALCVLVEKLGLRDNGLNASIQQERAVDTFAAARACCSAYERK